MTDTDLQKMGISLIQHRKEILAGFLLCRTEYPSRNHRKMSIRSIGSNSGYVLEKKSSGNLSSYHHSVFALELDDRGKWLADAKAQRRSTLNMDPTL